ncbi:unnamed protein product [Prorocentrum cordatum]|uniref:DNA-directed RNA polymerase n=1 Tax=Prorocentrum cordatum TaxID=2364126 RepID=A0ABN9XHK9_9DINO|nr:unnamed protein product [Polarella glacialis]
MTGPGVWSHLCLPRGQVSGSILTRMALNGNQVGNDHIDHAIARFAIAFKTYNYLGVQHENVGLPTNTFHYTGIHPDDEDHPNSANEIRVPLHRTNIFNKSAAAVAASRRALRLPPCLIGGAGPRRR